VWFNVAMIEQKRATPRAQALDRLSHTFSKDQEFCEALARKEPRSIGRLLAYLRWAHNYILPIQDDFHLLAGKHFAASLADEASVWTLTLVAGILRDLGLVPYLVVRGLIFSAGFLLRRSLESAGVLTHLWHDPSKAAHLGDPNGGPFKNAFTSESNAKKAADLKAQGVQKRFAACTLGRLMSDLYRILSGFTVHGDSPKQLVGSELAPTAFSCMFINRPDPSDKSLAKDLEVLANGCEILCVEVVSVHGTYSKKYGLHPSKGGEGGLLLTRLLERGPEAEQTHLVSAILDDLSWTEALED
jgi:hypothetical protein